MSWLDWLVVAGYGCLMIGVGLYYTRRNKSVDEYLLGGRRMSPIMLGLSLFATLVSTLSYLSIPGEMFGFGPMMTSQLACYPLVYVIVGYGLIPLLMRQPVTSAYEILESKLGLSIRLAGASVFLILRLGWMATILFATSSVVLVPLFGLSHDWIAWLCLALGAFAAIYSSQGGIKAVVMTDAIQSITMLLGAVLTLVVITVKLGGVSGWWPQTWPAHWKAPNWGFDPQARVSFGMLFISTTLWYVCTNGSDQMSIQRFLSTRDAPAARKTLLTAQFTDGLVQLLLAVTGIALLGYYSSYLSGLDPQTDFSEGGDQYFPRFIMTQMPIGLAGLLIAAILSAALSSLSSGINSTCAVLERDFLERFRTGASTPEQSVRRLKLMSWLLAGVSIALSMLNLLIEGNLVERCYMLVNSLTAPLFVLFFLALFVPWANAVGAWAGLIASIATAILIGFAKVLQLPVQISFVYILPSSLLVGVVVGMVVSWLAGLVKPAAPEN